MRNPSKGVDITISKYEIDLFKKNENRTCWLYKNETNINLKNTDRKAISMSITPVCTGDSFYFAVPIFSEKTGYLINYE